MNLGLIRQFQMLLERYCRRDPVAMAAGGDMRMDDRIGIRLNPLCGIDDRVATCSKLRMSAEVGNAGYRRRSRVVTID